MKRSVALLFALACVLAGRPARADADWFASLYSREGVELRADERTFALYALLNAMGYDEAPLVRQLPVPARDMHPVRLKVRSALRMDPVEEERLNRFFDAHAKPAEAYGRYVLSLGGPTGFERTGASTEGMRGFEALLAEGYSKLKAGALFAAAQDEYRAALKGYLGVVDAPVAAVRRLLKMREDEPPRVVLVVNLLDGLGKSYSSRSGEEELWVVVGPSKTPDLFAVAHELARSRMEPLVAAKVRDRDSAELAADLLGRAFASAALALPDAELEARARRDGFPALKEWTHRAEGFAKGPSTLDAFVAQAAPAVLKEPGKDGPGSSGPAASMKPGKR